MDKGDAVKQRHRRVYTPTDRALIGVANELRKDMRLTTGAIDRIIAFLKGDGEPQAVTPAPLIIALQKSPKLQSELEQFAERAAKEELGEACEKRARDALARAAQ